MATVIAVTSGKGGTGKTSLVGAVGSCLAALGHSTLCIDMDVGLRNLDLGVHRDLLEVRRQGGPPKGNQPDGGSHLEG